MKTQSLVTNGINAKLTILWTTIFLTILCTRNANSKGGENMDEREKVLIATMSILAILVVFAAACVTASSLTSHSPLYTVRMERVSSEMGFLPTEVNTFVYTAEKGCMLNCDFTGSCYTQPSDEIKATWFITCSWPNTCWDTCDDPTCPDTCPYTCWAVTCLYPTCPDTCELTCEAETCEGETCHSTCDQTYCTCKPPPCPMG